MSNVIAFDIDGALTEQRQRELFQQFKQEDNRVGIVTARSEIGLSEFLDTQPLHPTFARATRIKSLTLREIKRQYEADEYIYYGSWMRDRVASALAGWDYRQV